ncbi:hypothetical protein E1B28_001572 [Marasmius oreades]|uniref:Zn(2)-C6 fungal-type domain-containing protein n=1 Tax=Marasmius oreades TaxID=181124 RepID=A0A9P7V3N7_9AGAR|nr:uncharacterized protein E1B28_001572 [Marasmius oreades]KAG7099759.1 hypothetical protein E1B28_001572 [Marasmius oreades]
MSDESGAIQDNSIDTQKLQQQLAQDSHLVQQSPGSSAAPADPPSRKPKAPSVRRACVACHTGKTRCSEVLPCQSCIKRGLSATCSYPDPEGGPNNDHSHQNSASASTSVPNFAPPMYAAAPNLNQQHYFDYNGQYTGASSSSFRPAKRPRNLTDEEAAAITRNFSRGDFFVGSSAPVRIDPRLPVRLTLGEGDHVHFTVGENLTSMV